MAFIETRLLDKVAYGSVFGQEYNTRIIQLRSAHERRNANWSMPLGKYSILYNNLIPEDHVLVRDAHTACMGALHAFRFKDRVDFEATAEVIGTGTGAEQELQLVKTYTFGSTDFVRNIYKPVSGEVQIYEDGVELASSVDTTTGIVTITSSVGSEVITWTGEFDVPVRFASDRLDYNLVDIHTDGFVLTSDVELIEVRL